MNLQTLLAVSQAATELQWQDSPKVAADLAETLRPSVGAMYDVLASIPYDFDALWYDPTKNAFVVDFRAGHGLNEHWLSCWRKLIPTHGDSTWKSASMTARVLAEGELGGIPDVADGNPDGPGGNPDASWIRVLGGTTPSRPQEKAAYSPTLRGMGEIAGYLPGGRFSWSVPGVPKHLQGMLAGGLLGAGLGYGLGYVGEQMLPDTWQRGKLRKSLALAGGAIGAAPGLGRMAVNSLSGRHPLIDSLRDAYPDDAQTTCVSCQGGSPILRTAQTCRTCRKTRICGPQTSSAQPSPRCRKSMCHKGLRRLSPSLATSYRRPWTSTRCRILCGVIP